MIRFDLVDRVGVSCNRRVANRNKVARCSLGRCAIGVKEREGGSLANDSTNTPPHIESLSVGGMVLASDGSAQIVEQLRCKRHVVDMTDCALLECGGVRAILGGHEACPRMVRNTHVVEDRTSNDVAEPHENPRECGRFIMWIEHCVRVFGPVVVVAQSLKRRNVEALMNIDCFDAHTVQSAYCVHHLVGSPFGVAARIVKFPAIEATIEVCSHANLRLDAACAASVVYLHGFEIAIEEQKVLMHRQIAGDDIEEKPVQNDDTGLLVTVDTSTDNENVVAAVATLDFNDAGPDHGHARDTCVEVLHGLGV